MAAVEMQEHNVGISVNQHAILNNEAALRIT